MHHEVSVTVPRPPAEVFPWLFDEDKVPRWTSGLEGYDGVRDGELRVGSRVRQRLEIGGQKLNLDMEVVRLDAPTLAETRFEAAGIEILNGYELRPNGAGTQLTQTIDAEPKGFKARMLAPMLEPRLREKLERDLEALRTILSAPA